MVARGEVGPRRQHRLPVGDGGREGCEVAMVHASLSSVPGRTLSQANGTHASMVARRRRIDRLYALLDREARLMTGPELAARLGVCVRTVYADLRELKTRNPRVRTERGLGVMLMKRSG